MKTAILMMCFTFVACGLACGRSPILPERDARATDVTSAGKPDSPSLHTPQVSLVTSDFWIMADGMRFNGGSTEIDVHGDPGSPDYTTLELVWNENDREMRFNIYFAADAKSWWAEEMRTYDGQVDGDWLRYTGPFFKSPIGQTFHGDVDLINDRSDRIRGEVHIHGLTMSTSLTGRSSP